MVYIQWNIHLKKTKYILYILLQHGWQYKLSKTSQRDNTVNSVFTLNIADLCLVASTTYGPLSPARWSLNREQKVSPEHCGVCFTLKKVNTSEVEFQIPDNFT